MSGSDWLCNHRPTVLTNHNWFVAVLSSYFEFQSGLGPELAQSWDWNLSWDQEWEQKSGWPCIRGFPLHIGCVWTRYGLGGITMDCVWIEQTDHVE